MKSRMAAFIKAYKYSLGIFVLLFILSFIFRITATNGHVIKDVIFAILNSLLLFAIIPVFARTPLRIPAAILLSFLMAADMGLLYLYKGVMNHSVAASIAETNLSEIYNVVLIVLPFWLPAFALFCFLWLKSSLEIKRGIKRYILTPLSAVLFILLGVFVLPAILYVHEDEEPLALMIEGAKASSVILSLNDVLFNKYPFVINDFFIMGAYFEEMNGINSEINRIKTLPQGISLEGDSVNTSKIFLVIGESANCENHSLYGYPIKTTPFLDSLAANKDLLSFYRHVISPAPFTREALRLTFSYASPLDIEPFINNKNLLNLAKDAGYNTYWISNQTKIGSYNSIMNLISNNSDSLFFLTGINSDDLDLIPAIKSIIKPNKKQFIVVHLRGSHWTYSDRCDTKDTEALGSSGETIEYDKSIHHTDRVLKEIYNVTKSLDENALVYYYSDHGEVINVGHGILNKYKIQYRIPLVVMQNKPFINTDSIVGKYYDKQTGRLNTSGNIFILGELMGYRVADSLVEKSKIEGRYTRQADGSYCLYDEIKEAP
ncbi:sulfatase-like hydrolase/transferase [Viscerimonas tarda]